MLSFLCLFPLLLNELMRISNNALFLGKAGNRLIQEVDGFQTYEYAVLGFSFQSNKYTAVKHLSVSKAMRVEKLFKPHQ